MVTTSCARAFATGAALATMLLGPGLSLAQSGNDLAAQVRGCRAVQRDRERLACYDAVFANIDKAAVAAAPPTAAARSAAPVVARPAPPDPPRAAAPARAAAPPPAAPASEPAGPRTVRIVQVNDSIPGAARLIADTGEVWVQTNSGGRTMLPQVPFEATLESGSLGSQFLIPEGRRAIRVSARD